MKKIVFTVGLIIIALGISGQSPSDHHEEDHHSNGIGFGLGMSHLINENEWVPGFHLHYGKLLGEKQRFSVGSGVELLLDDHRHSSVALSFGYGLTSALSVAYGPGLDFPLAKDAEKAVHLAHHFEISYEFDMDFLHLGPMVEYGFSSEDQHWMVGIHAGFGF